MVEIKLYNDYEIIEIDLFALMDWASLTRIKTDEWSTNNINGTFAPSISFLHEEDAVAFKLHFKV